MSLHDLIALLVAAGIPYDTAYSLAFYGTYNRRSGDERRTDTRSISRQDRRQKVVL